MSESITNDKNLNKPENIVTPVISDTTDASKEPAHTGTRTRRHNHRRIQSSSHIGTRTRRHNQQTHPKFQPHRNQDSKAPTTDASKVPATSEPGLEGTTTDASKDASKDPTTQESLSKDASSPDPLSKDIVHIATKNRRYNHTRIKCRYQRPSCTHRYE